jgi:hypothetical protein
MIFWLVLKLEISYRVIISFKKISSFLFEDFCMLKYFEFS